MKVYIVMVIYKDKDLPMQPFAFDDIDKMNNFSKKAKESITVEETMCYILSVR